MSFTYCVAMIHRRNLFVAIALFVLAIGVSLGLGVLMFGLRPATFLGWVLTALIGAPVYVLLEALFVRLGGVPPFGSAGRTFSWDQIASGTAARYRRKELGRTVARISIAAMAVGFIVWVARSVLGASHWFQANFH